MKSLLLTCTLPIVWLPTSLVSFLLLAIAANFAHADKIKLHSVDGFFDATAEVVGVVGTKIIVKEANGDTGPIPLAELDKDSLIRITAELGRQMKASPKDIASNFARADKIKLHSVDGFFDATAEVVGVVGTKIIVKEANGDTGPIPLAELDKDSLIRIAAELGRQMKGSAVAEEPATIVEVVAVGAGLSLEAAQKDAYRQAVRTVVGLYVDSKTIVENDQLIEDRILSASNGFVKTAKTIPGSAKQKDGIWRVRVRAKVEVSEVSARLKKENIATRSLDGESLFAKALTKMERSQNTQQLLQELLGELPGMVKVTLDGEPDYDEAKGELIYQVKLTPDMDAYRKFLPRLTKALDKLAVKKLPENTLRPQPITVPRYQGLYRLPFKSIIDPRTKPTQSIISVLTFWNERHSSHRWTTYVVELGELDPPLESQKKRTLHWLQTLSRSCDSRNPYDYPQLKMRVTAQFLDKQKVAVELDPWEWKCDDYRYYRLQTAADPNYGTLKSPVPNLMVTPLQKEILSNRLNLTRRGRLVGGVYFAIAVAPICMARTLNIGGDSAELLMRREITMERRISFPLEDLKKINEIKLNVETFVDKSK